MSIADKYFRDAVKQILEHGSSDEGQKVRAHWPDGTPAHTKKTFCYICRYKPAEEFPILTLRKQAFKGMVKELLWIWRDKSNNIKDLDSHIWDAWADKDGSIGKAYGYQLKKLYKFPEGLRDQVDHLIYELKNNPASRRIITNIYNFEDLHQMKLYPCVFETMWDVSDGKLNMTLIQRSGDLLAAAAPGGWDCAQYALLQMMIAQVCGLKVGEFVHVINNLHIYDRHIPLVKKILKNAEHNAPTVKINPNVKDFYDFKLEDFELVDYKATKLEETFEVAE